MPSLDLAYFDHLIFLILAVYVPLDGLRRIRALRRSIATGREGARLSEYRKTMAEQWLLTAIVAGGWIILNRSAAMIGLEPRVTLPALVGYGVTLLSIGLLLLQSRILVSNDEKMQQARQAMGTAIILMPQDRREKRAFDWLSITAGICEELLYRGFLLLYLTSWLPSLPTWLIVIAGSLFFGFAHIYQGAMGMLKTGLVGLLLGGLYWLTGSLWAPMLLHVAIDLNSGWLAWRLRQAEIDGQVSGNASDQIGGDINDDDSVAAPT